MDRCLKCVSRLENVGVGFCPECVSVLEKFRGVGMHGICWNCADFHDKAGVYFCGNCGIEQQPYTPRVQTVDEVEDRSDDVLASVSETVADALPKTTPIDFEPKPLFPAFGSRFAALRARLRKPAN